MDITKGKLMAPKKPSDMQEGMTHKMELGGVLVIDKYEDSSSIYVTFIETGFKTKAQAGHIRRGTVIDRMQPRVFKVGFIGVGEFNTKDNPLAYDRWRNMLKRCYDPEYHDIKPTYKNCTVCDEWHNFQNFAEWFEGNYPKDGELYHLDKDFLVEGNKLYSPEMCAFITPFKNNEIAHRKLYKLKNPKGEVVDILNLSKFCRDNNYCRSGFKNLISGKLKSYKGWTLPN